MIFKLFDLKVIFKLFDLKVDTYLAAGRAAGRDGALRRDLCELRGGARERGTFERKKRNQSHIMKDEATSSAKRMKPRRKY